MRNLRNLLEESHKDLHQWFLLHQECLLVQDDDGARQAFSAFADYLSQHLGFENSFVLPAFANNGQLRWGMNVYHKEHDKLLAMLEGIKQVLQHYYLLQGREKRLALLDVLDRQQSFYHVMEHHEQREGQDIFHYVDTLESTAGEQWLLVDAALFERYKLLKQALKSRLESL